jgi:putative salt-induced outer membrane protein YdiY
MRVGGPFIAGIVLWAVAGDPETLADEIRMQNGDRLTGRVVRQDGDRLTLQTDYAGTLEIAWTEVREVKLDEPLDMVMTDDRLLAVTEIVRDADRLRVEPSPPTALPMRVDPKQVQVIAPEDWEIRRGYRLGGALNASLTSDRGNSHTNDVYIDYRLDYRRQRSRLESYGQLEYETSRGQKLTDNWLVFNKYVHDLQAPWFASGWLQFNKDRFADLRLRTLIGPAIGYRFYAREDLTLSAEIGAIHLDEQFYDSADQVHWGPGLSLEYEQRFWNDRIELYHRQLSFTAVNGTGEDLLLTWTGLSVPLDGGFVGALEYQIEYDSSPSDQALTTDTKLLVKLGYQW